MGAEVALAAWVQVFLAELARSGRPGVEVRVAYVALPAVCRAPGLLLMRDGWRSGPCCGRPDRFVPGPTRVCHYVEKASYKVMSSECPPSLLKNRHTMLQRLVIKS